MLKPRNRQSTTMNRGIRDDPDPDDIDDLEDQGTPGRPPLARIHPAPEAAPRGRPTQESISNRMAPVPINPMDPLPRGMTCRRCGKGMAPRIDHTGPGKRFRIVHCPHCLGKHKLSYNDGGHLIEVAPFFGAPDLN